MEEILGSSILRLDYTRGQLHLTSHARCRPADARYGMVIVWPRCNLTLVTRNGLPKRASRKVGCRASAIPCVPEHSSRAGRLKRHEINYKDEPRYEDRPLRVERKEDGSESGALATSWARKSTYQKFTILTTIRISTSIPSFPLSRSLPSI